MVARILSGIVGLFMLWTCLGGYGSGNTRAGLAMPLLEGMGGNTQFGDFTSFFFTAGLFACIGHTELSIHGFMHPYHCWVPQRF
ncbi:MAG: hypothetical protein Ct9H300mP3_00370 [Gammaproteobacteria bacterium]|nr:MAG: hypothetical protein Ct9H300mP3_00370 [Gammaproteobacteria bacterium]